MWQCPRKTIPLFHKILKQPGWPWYTTIQSIHVAFSWKHIYEITAAVQCLHTPLLSLPGTEHSMVVVLDMHVGVPHIAAAHPTP